MVYDIDLTCTVQVNSQYVAAIWLVDLFKVIFISTVEYVEVLLILATGCVLSLLGQFKVGL